MEWKRLNSAGYKYATFRIRFGSISILPAEDSERLRLVFPLLLWLCFILRFFVTCFSLFYLFLFVLSALLFTNVNMFCIWWTNLKRMPI